MLIPSVIFKSDFWKTQILQNQFFWEVFSCLNYIHGNTQYIAVGIKSQIVSFRAFKIAKKKVNNSIQSI